MKRKEYGKQVAIKARASYKLEERDLIVLDMVLEENPRRVLDLGCGVGVISKKIKETDPWIELALADYSREVLGKIDFADEVLCLDIENGLPDYWKNQFDVVMLVEVLEHIFDTDFLLEEIKKVLKPGGKLVLTVPNAVRLTYRGLMLFGYSPRCVEYRATGEEAGHIRAFDVHRLKTLLKDHGFKTEKIKGDVVNFVLFKSKKLGKIFPNLANTIIVSCRYIGREENCQQDVKCVEESLRQMS